MALYISTGDGVVEYRTVYLYCGRFGPVEYGAVDLYWEPFGRVCRLRYPLGTV